MNKFKRLNKISSKFWKITGLRDDCNRKRFDRRRTLESRKENELKAQGYYSVMRVLLIEKSMLEKDLLS